MNNITVVGRVTGKPVTKITAQGKKVATLHIAVDNPFVKKTVDGKEQNETDFFKISVWENQAKFVEDFIEKGMRVGATGHLTLDKWVNQEGERGSTLVIQSGRIELLTSKKEKESKEESKVEKQEEVEEFETGEEDHSFYEDKNQGIEMPF